MGVVGEKLDIDFVISTGDNFYKDGLTGVSDPAFNESFINIYTASSLQKHWYNGKVRIGFTILLATGFLWILTFSLKNTLMKYKITIFFSDNKICE